VKGEHREAAESYLRVTKEKVTAEELVAMMGKPEIQFTNRPLGVARFAASCTRRAGEGRAEELARPLLPRGARAGRGIDGALRPALRASFETRPAARATGRSSG